MGASEVKCSKGSKGKCSKEKWLGVVQLQIA